MPERPGVLPALIEKINSRLPLTFRVTTGQTPPSVGKEEVSFAEDLRVGDAKIYFRRAGKVYVFFSGQAFQASEPPGPTDFSLVLLDDQYLYWATDKSLPVNQRSAGIRWAVADATPDRFEFSTGRTASFDRLYLNKVATGEDANLDFSPADLLLSDSSIYTTAPATSVYRGLTLDGTFNPMATPGSATTSLLTNGDFDDWTTGANGEYPDFWWTRLLTSKVTGRDGSGFALQIITGDNNDSTAHTRTPGGKDPDSLGSCYFQLSKNTNYTWVFWLRMTSASAARDMNLRIAAFANVSDTTPARSVTPQVLNFTEPVAYTLSGSWSNGDTQFTLRDIPNDNVWREVTINFDTNSVGGSVGDPFFAELRFYGHPTTAGGITSTWQVDDVVLGTGVPTTLTVDLTTRPLTLDQFNFSPEVSLSGDSLTLTDFTGAYLIPTYKPQSPSGGTIVVPSLAGVRAGVLIDTSLHSGTSTVTNTYGLHALKPTFGTNSFAGYFDDKLAISKSGSLTIWNSFRTDSAQAAAADYILPTARPSAANQVLTSTAADPSVMSWTSLASAGAVTQINADSGSATPSAGVITFAGGTNGIDVTASGSTVTFSFDPTETFSAPIPATNGGTGFSSYTVGDLLYADTTTTLAKLADVAAGAWLRAGGVSTAPAWQAAAALTKTDDTNVTLTLGGAPTTSLLTATSLTLGWTGQLAISRGGTSASTALGAFNALSPLTTRGDLLTRDASNNVRLAIGSSGKWFRTDGTDPGWSTPTLANSYARGDIVRASAANVLSGLTVGSSGTILRSDGTDPAWATLATAGIASGTGTTNILTMWTDGPNGVLGDSPLQWDGATTLSMSVGTVVGPGTYESGTTGPAWRFRSTAAAGTGGSVFEIYDGSSIGANLRFKVDGDGHVLITGIAGTSAELRLKEPTGLNYIGFKSPALSTDVTYTLPTTATTGLLHNNGSNVWTWSAVDLASADVTGDLPFSNLAQGSARSVLGVTGNATADFASIQGTANQVLVVNSAGTALAFGQVNLASSSAITGDLPFANLTQGSALSVLGVTGNATADVASIAAGSDHQVLRRSGTALTFGAVNLAQSAAVTGVLPIANGGTNSATGAGLISGLTTNKIPKAASATTLADGPLTVAASGGLITHATSPSITAGGLETSYLLQPTFPAGAYTASGNYIGLRYFPLVTSTGPSSGAPDITGLSFDFGSVVDGAWGDWVGVEATTSGALSSGGSIATWGGFKSQFILGRAFTGTATSYLAEVDDNSFVGDVAPSTWAAYDITTASAPAGTHFYGLRVPDVSAATNKHGWASFYDCNLVNSKYLYWGAAETTVLGSRSGAIRMNGTSTLDFEIGTTAEMTLSSTTLTLGDANNIAVGTGTGTKIATSTSQKIAFYNSTPIVQRSGAAQAAVSTTGATSTTPFGYTTAAQADAIVTLVNELRAALVALGLIKGSA